MADDVAASRAMVGRAQALLVARLYKRDSDGKFSSGGGSGPDRGMSKQDYEGTYGGEEEVWSESSFGDGGYVQTSNEGTLQIGIRHKDGTTDVFADIDRPSEAQELVDVIDWARGYDADGQGDRGPDQTTGMLDWKASDATGHIAGIRPNGDVAVAHADGSEGIVFTHAEAGELVNALQEQVSSAEEMIAEWGGQWGGDDGQGRAVGRRGCPPRPEPEPARPRSVHCGG